MSKYLVSILPLFIISFFFFDIEESCYLKYILQYFNKLIFVRISAEVCLRNVLDIIQEFVTIKYLKLRSIVMKKENVGNLFKKMLIYYL